MDEIFRIRNSSKDEDWEDWCTIQPACGNSSNATEYCTLLFCPDVLSYSIDDSKIRVYDLFLLFCSLLFLGYLIIHLASTIKKLYKSLALFRLLYFMIFLIPVVSCLYETVSLATGYHSQATKVMHVLLRGVILLTEISVVVFGLFIKLCGSSVIKLTATVVTIVAVSSVFTTVEGVMEFLNPNQLACDSFKFFTHGGMIFLFSTSILFALAYGSIFIVYIFGLYRRWDLPSKKSFYRYALFLSLVNIVQAVGSFLWFTGKYRPTSGNIGICLTIITNVVYVVTFAPMVYWIFLSNYFRMNDALKSVEVEKNQINVVSNDCDSSLKPKKTTSNPLHIRKGRLGLFADHTPLFVESYGTSSSYGSLDEETFVRQETPEPGYK